MKTQFNTFIITLSMVNKEGKYSDRIFQVSANDLVEAKEKSMLAIEEIASMRGFKVDNVKVNQLYNIPSLD